MNKNDVIEWLDAELKAFPERMSGNEIAPLLIARIQPIVHAYREAVIEALRDLIAFRCVQSKRTPADAAEEAKLWLALELAAAYRLKELSRDLDSLIDDVKGRRSFLPYYAEMLEPYRDELQ